MHTHTHTHTHTKARTITHTQAHTHIHVIRRFVVQTDGDLLSLFLDLPPQLQLSLMQRQARAEQHHHAELHYHASSSLHSPQVRTSDPRFPYVCCFLNGWHYTTAPHKHRALPVHRFPLKFAYDVIIKYQLVDLQDTVLKT